MSSVTMRMRWVVMAVCGLMVVGSVAQAAVRPARIFRSNMVLQRDQAVPIWGWADPGETVSVSFAGQTCTAVAGSDGKWQVRLAAMPANKTPQVLKIVGSSTNQMTNILVGDVWLCAGQSNMGVTLSRCPERGSPLTNGAARIRYFSIPCRGARQPEMDLPNPMAPSFHYSWQEAGAQCSAVGYFFARELVRELDVPMGLIVVAWPGAVIDPWIPKAGLGGVPELAKAQARVLSWDQLPTEGSTNRPPEPPALGADNISGSNPTMIFNGRVNPLVPMAIKGVLWYQGESNDADGAAYEPKLRALIGSWRAVWGLGDFPFYFVQLPPSGGHMPIREAQAMVQGITNTGMAVTTDIGENNLHPTNKLDVGRRLALLAFAKTYGRAVECHGPTYESCQVESNRMKVVFSHVGTGLFVGEKNGAAPPAPMPNGVLTRFSVAGSDQKWAWAQAEILSNAVVLSCDAVPVPISVRYDFGNAPSGSVLYLYNSEGLPAAPFSSM